MSDEPLISTRERPGDYDALESAKPDEPIFVIQGGDPFGPATVEHWADLARTAGRSEAKADTSAKLLKKATSAEMVAWAMRDYQAGRGAEVIAEAKRFESEDVTDRNVILARATDRLNNALAEAIMVAEQLEALGETLVTVHAARIRDAADTLNDVSADIEPRRTRGRAVA
jgi:hypothetical protein